MFSPASPLEDTLGSLPVAAVRVTTNACKTVFRGPWVLASLGALIRRSSIQLENWASIASGLSTYIPASSLRDSWVTAVWILFAWS